MIAAAIITVNQRGTEDTVVLAVALKYTMHLGDLMCGFLHNLGNLEGKMVSIKRCLMLLEIP